MTFTFRCSRLPAAAYVRNMEGRYFTSSGRKALDNTDGFITPLRLSLSNNGWTGNLLHLLRLLDQMIRLLIWSPLNESDRTPCRKGPRSYRSDCFRTNISRFDLLVGLRLGLSHEQCFMGLKIGPKYVYKNLVPTIN